MFVVTSNLYSIPKLQYDVTIKKFDSTRVKQLTEGKIYFKINRPEYHINMDNQYEKIYFQNNYFEINHHDSIISVMRNPKMDSNASNPLSLMAKLKDMKFKYEIESEDKNFIKIIMKFEEEIPDLYLSLVIDKKTLFITQNQLTRKEWVKGELKLFFYQMDIYNYLKNPDLKIDGTLISSIIKDENAKSKSIYKRYKIEFKN